jgi:hypothetical protein
LQPNLAKSAQVFATTRLAESDDLRNLCWLLERRYPDLFGLRKPDLGVNATVNVGLPENVLQRARELAREKSAASSEVTPANGGKRGTD